MDEANFFFRVLTLSQAVLLAICLFRGREALAVLAGVCALSFGCYLMLPFVHGEFVGLWFVCAIIATVIPSQLWLLAYWFFNDIHRVPIWLAVLTMVYTMMSFIPDGQARGLIEQDDLRNLVFMFFPQVLKMLLVIHVVYMALVDRGADLVGERLRMRKPIAAVTGTVAGLVILVEIWAQGAVPISIEAAGSILMFLGMLGANVFLLRSRLDLGAPEPAQHRLPPLSPEVVVPSGEYVPPKEADRVLRAMTEERLYAQHGLTLTDLAAHLRTPVHKLRETINKGLGYRNFNRFLNHYRIAEASRRLRSEQHLPILTIALDVGFKSLSSFNAAFRDEHGETPSEFRSRQD